MLVKLKLRATGPGGGDDSADVYMRVDRGQPDRCVHYTLDYHF